MVPDVVSWPSAWMLSFTANGTPVCAARIITTCSGKAMWQRGHGPKDPAYECTAPHIHVAHTVKRRQRLASCPASRGSLCSCAYLLRLVRNEPGAACGVAAADKVQDAVCHFTGRGDTCVAYDMHTRTVSTSGHLPHEHRLQRMRSDRHPTPCCLPALYAAA